MSKHKVVHFEIPTSDFSKAKEFYGKIFGWNLQMWEDRYMMANTTEVNEEQMPTEAGGINGGFYIRNNANDKPSFVIETDSIDGTLMEIEKAGGKTTRPKTSVGDMGFMAEFTDPEGNEISLWEVSNKA